jgi:four helix bundle protein
MGNYRKLQVWQLSKIMAVEIYKLTSKQPFLKDYGLKDQMQRSAVSIPSNIAEGDESGTNKISIRYFYIAKGSVAELQTQIIIANEIGYLEDSVKDILLNDCDKISIMLSKIIKARSENY